MQNSRSFHRQISGNLKNGHVKENLGVTLEVLCGHFEGTRVPSGIIWDLFGGTLGVV